MTNDTLDQFFLLGGFECNPYTYNLHTSTGFPACKEARVPARRVTEFHAAAWEMQHFPPMDLPCNSATPMQLWTTTELGPCLFQEL